MRNAVLAPSSSHSGFSLVDLMIVVALLGVLSALAIPQLISQRRLIRSAAVSREILTQLRYARQQAMSQRQVFTFQYDNATKQTLIIDHNNNPNLGGLAVLANTSYPNTAGMVVVNRVSLASGGVASAEITYGIPTGLPTAALADGVSRTNLSSGKINNSLNANTVYERGVMSIVELNMRNVARWLDGVYDANLLAGTNAISANIDGGDGYVVYVSDRRGDKVKTERDGLGPLNTTNGMVDNEDIYGPNSLLDAGEDVIDAGVDGSGAPKEGTLQKDITELPDPAALAGTSGSDRVGRANLVATWRNSNNYFRRSVRIFNGEDMVFSGAANKLSETKGITISSENMVYIWGNFNTTGINGQPSGASTLNDPTQTYFYTGDQIPASIVVDAIFPLSKTWFDSVSAIYPDDLGKREADRNADDDEETAVRAGIIAGNNLSALAGSPDGGNGDESRLNGGMHNFPRFLERWRNRWNFVGSLIPLYQSTQAVGQYNNDSTIYSPPIRNWAFDSTFQDPNRLPPGTPQFQYFQPTAFRQIF